MEVVAVTEKPIQKTGWAFVGTFAQVQSLHKLHELIFHVIHHLSRNGHHPAVFRHPLNLFAGHGTNEVGNMLKSLLESSITCNVIVWYPCLRAKASTLLCTIGFTNEGRRSSFSFASADQAT